MVHKILGQPRPFAIRAHVHFTDFSQFTDRLSEEKRVLNAMGVQMNPIYIGFVRDPVGQFYE